VPNIKKRLKIPMTTTTVVVTAISYGVSDIFSRGTRSRRREF